MDVVENVGATQTVYVCEREHFERVAVALGVSYRAVEGVFSL